MSMGVLNGKYAVVTGGAKGIGAAVAARFVKEGAAGVAILDYDLPLAQKTGAALGEGVLVLACDVADKESVKAAFAKVYEAFGRIDILVNNAGITGDAMFHKMTDEQWERVLRVNLDGTYYCTKQVVGPMREQAYGKIINLASAAADGNAGQANYSASKAGIIGLTKTLARELAGKNITVNVLTPTMIETDIILTVPEENLQMIKQMNPSRRLGTADEVAGVILFLASDDSSYVNGAVIPVNGASRT
ncbi:3-oxoacyl-ACP reductase FabG [Ruminococcaceae bacterium OttesenSCG-928-O06]|nr:3-oxoacyl-ACP reductase FabG [Ruminococcaceae bacterium OttesenSCG-928-O06]